MTPNVDGAMQFYRDRMGMTLGSLEEGLVLEAGPMRMYLDPGPISKTVFEILTLDLAAAKAKLRFYGYEVVNWMGPGKTNLVRDPFGLEFNVFEQAEESWVEIVPDEHVHFRPIIGAAASSVPPIAEFYSMVLQSPANRLSDGSLLISGGSVGMRVFDSEHDFPAVWLSNVAPVEQMIEGGAVFLDAEHQLLRDPFGVCWSIEPRSESTRAAVHPI